MVGVGRSIGMCVRAFAVIMGMGGIIVAVILAFGMRMGLLILGMRFGTGIGAGNCKEKI